MNKTFTCLVACLLPIFLKAQTQPAGAKDAGVTYQRYQPYGKVDMADLDLKVCDFEPDANAMVLFNKSQMFYDDAFYIDQEIHKRIKIFKDNAKDVANIRIEFYGGNRLEFITGIQAETINIVDGKQEITKLDKKQVYLQHIDKLRDAYVFTMPNVKAGSVIEYKYHWGTNDYANMPDWYFQEKIPVRYSELETEIPEMLYFKTEFRSRVSLSKHTTTSKARSIGAGADHMSFNSDVDVRIMENVHSLPDEPYMSSDADNLQCIIFQLTGIKPVNGFQRSFSDTWAKIGGRLADDDDFGSQLKRKLNNEEAIISKASALKTTDEKIAYVFNEVKNDMKWNDVDRWYTNDGTYRAWENKTGNSTEINLILYHLLKKSGVDAYPMVVSTREHGRVNPYYPNLYQFNRAVVYVPVDSTRRYVLDASNKYNSYNETPDYLLNSSGFYIDKSKDTYDILFLQRQSPVRQVIGITAEIKPDGKISGTAQINCMAYKRIAAIKRYKTDGEKKYIDFLRDKDNSLRISSVKFENMEIDTLPLTQNIKFDQDLTGSDDNYIYFKPNMFTSEYSNPFLQENRFTDIDFGYPASFTISGNYKEPTGYKIDAMPKSVSMAMADNSITFKRIVAEQDGAVVVRYSLFYKKAIYFKEDYPELHNFFKKMSEMMNEQIVMKKS